MRNAIRVAGVLVALVVCAASATSFRGSYKDTNLGGGSYMVTVEVNSKTSYATAREYAFRRAGEVCGGAGFSVLDADGNSYGPTGATTIVNNNIATTTTHGGGHDFTLLYSCNGGGGAQPAAQQGGNWPPPESLPRR